jgi:hypothetical protein
MMPRNMDKGQILYKFRVYGYQQPTPHHPEEVGWQLSPKEDQRQVYREHLWALVSSAANNLP